MAAFEELNSVNVNAYTEKKNGLTYLSWSNAWEEVKKRYPEASYTIWKDPEGRPYTYDKKTGYMVYTTVTIEGITHEMWLPVMDGANKAMKDEPYTYKVKEYDRGRWTGGWTDKEVEAATMFDINKTIMRCLTKNLAMFGLGLYIYKGEDLPETEEARPETKSEVKRDTTRHTKQQEVITAELKQKVMAYIKRHEFTEEDKAKLCTCYKVSDIADLNAQHCQHYITMLERNGGNIDA